jgi:hypothetical protein
MERGYDLHNLVHLTPPVVGGVKNLKHTADVGNGLPLDKELISLSLFLREGFAYAEGFAYTEAFGYGCVAVSFHAGVSGLTGLDEDAHPSRTGCQGLRHNKFDSLPI